MKWITTAILKTRIFYWKIMLSKYQFEGTNFEPIGAHQVLVIIMGRSRPTGFDQTGAALGYEEVLQIVFPNGAVEEVLATEENLKYANALIADKKREPKNS